MSQYFNKYSLNQFNLLSQMIKIVNLACPYLKKSIHTKTHFQKFYFASTTFDPYYILGVEKTAEFKQIKKAFFKLANQYHPDKNDTKDGSVKFLKAKQAFEAIKMQKGLMKPQNFVQSTPYDSVRPNPDQFMSDQQEGSMSDRDYRIFREKASQMNSDQYQRFNTSFRTIHDINEIKIKVEEGQMKDSSERLGLSSMKIKIKLMSQSSRVYVIIGAIGIGLIFMVISEVDQGVQKDIQKQVVVSESQMRKGQHIENHQQRVKKSIQLNNQKVKLQEIYTALKDSSSGEISSKKKQEKSNELTAMINSKKKESVLYGDDENNV